MKYATLLLVLSAVSLSACGPSEDASAPTAPSGTTESPQPMPTVAGELAPQAAEAAPPQPTEPAVQAPSTAPGKPVQPAAPDAAPAAAPSGAAKADVPQADLAHGQQVYRQACAFCHDRGAAGAPKAGDASAWAPRLAQGMDALYASALRGKGAMPAKGGNPSLSEADLKAAVDALVAQVR